MPIGMDGGCEGFGIGGVGIASHLPNRSILVDVRTDNELFFFGGDNSYFQA